MLLIYLVFIVSCFFGNFQLEMVEVNLLQLRSVNEINKVDESNQNKGDDNDIKQIGNEQSKKETIDALKDENEFAEMTENSAFDSSQDEATNVQ